MKKGLIYIFTGDGKGKTSAALGVVCRMLMIEKKVVWISWFKEISWKMAEIEMQKYFPSRLKMYWMGKGFYKGPMDHGTEIDHKMAADEALEMAKQILLKNRKGEEKIDLLILDEVIKAVNEGLIKTSEVLELLKLRDEVHIVLTGHKSPRELIEAADLVTEMKKVKHPYDKGVLAVRGLDF